MRQREQGAEQADVVEQVERRGVHRIAAKIAKEVGVLFEHRHRHPGAREEQPRDHPGGTAADDHHGRRAGQARLHPAAGACSSRASGMIARIRAQKCLRQTSLSLSGPIWKLCDCMPCWTRVIRAVSSALT